MYEEYFTAEEAAQFLNLSRSSIYKLSRTNKIATIKVGGKVLFEKKEIEKYGAITIAPTTKASNKKQIHYWMIPRSVRKLVTLQEMIKNDYINGIIGGQWKGTRTNHRKRDKNLQDASIRGTSTNGFVDANPGGGRTDVALLVALGFYAFDNSGNINLTYQGKQMLSSTNPASIITEQLLQFRYPSVYSASINMDPSFKVFPYRFLLRLLTRDELKDDGSIVANDGKIRLTQKEIAEYVVPHARKDSDIDMIVRNISISRKSGTILSPLKKYDDIANTFINNLEITGFIERDSNSSLYIKDKDMKTVLDLLSKKPRNFEYEVGKEFEFQDRLGMDPTKAKYSSKITSNRTGGEMAVQHLLLDFLSKNPMTKESINDQLIISLAERAGTTEAIARKVVTTVLREDPKDIFSRQYIAYSTSGRAFARDFEISTAKIFSELTGNARWVGKEGKSPDVTLSLLPTNLSDSLNVIIDCKAEKNYTIPNDHLNRMSVEDTGYIPVYKADVFIYVANRFGSSFEKRLKKIETKCKIPGSGISAEDLVYLLEKHRVAPLTHSELLSLFSSGKIITISDINHLFDSKITPQ